MLTEKSKRLKAEYDRIYKEVPDDLVLRQTASEKLLVELQQRCDPTRDEFEEMTSRGVIIPGGVFFDLITTGFPQARWYRRLWRRLTGA